jgi:hypothetical protein
LSNLAVVKSWGGKKNWQRRDLNLRPRAYESL